MAVSTNRRAVRWLRGQLPELVAAGAISSENARAIERHYESADSRSSFGFVLLAIVGSALIGAGIILLIAHNWDGLSRATRSTIAFLPLIVAQVLGVFVLMRRNESQTWRESVAICNVAAVGTAISLVSQTYQIQGTFADFICIWLLLSIPIVYLFRTTFGAAAYIVGTVVWLFARISWFGHSSSPNPFWLMLLLIVPYFAGCLRRDSSSSQTAVLSILLLLASTAGLTVTAESTQANLGGIAFAGLFASTYLSGMTGLGNGDGRRLPPVALLSGIGIGATAVVLSFESAWHMSTPSTWALSAPSRGIGIAIELLFPVVAVLILGLDVFRKRRISFSIAAAVIPLVAGAAWVIANLAPATRRGEDSAYSFGAALIFNIYTLTLGVELLARGVRANSPVRANFGLLVIAALAIARFFDSDLDFVTRGVGFIVVGAGFLVANIIFFRRRVAA